MRDEFARAIVELFARRKEMVFLTADLGYMALEGVAKALGPRFVNVGVAEQNAVSLAAGLASEGQLPFVYSMAAFTSLRPYAQIRDNLCLHHLPVKLVGNGGGYGYGIMGATHHAIEDVAAMRALPNMKVFIPLVDSDVGQALERMVEDPAPNYLRLNRGARLEGVVANFTGWRCLKAGPGPVVISMGPVVENLFTMGRPEILETLEIWSVGVLPLEPLPAQLARSIVERPCVLTMEEHRVAGGLGEALGAQLLKSGVMPRRFESLAAEGYPSGRYGSQKWHQEENGLRGARLEDMLEALVRG